MRRELEGRFDEVRRRLRRAEAALSWRPPAREAVAAKEVEKAGVEIAGAKEEMKELDLSRGDYVAYAYAGVGRLARIMEEREQ